MTNYKLCVIIKTMKQNKIANFIYSIEQYVRDNILCSEEESKSIVRLSPLLLFLWEDADIVMHYSIEYWGEFVIQYAKDNQLLKNS